MVNPLNLIFPYISNYQVTQTYVWRHALKWRITEASKRKDDKIGHYYEFGVYKMRSVVHFHILRQVLSIWNKKLKDIHIFCFDSFQGLPEPAEGDIGKGKLLVPGAYSSTLEYAKKVAKKYKLTNVEFIPGFYSSSLTTELKQRLEPHPPGFIHIDCDIYSSTKEVLGWLDGFALLGAIYFFDDIWSYYGHPDAGQMKAINEYNENFSNRGMLVEHPLSMGSRKVYAYVPRDPTDIVKPRKDYGKRYGER